VSGRCTVSGAETRYKRLTIDVAPEVYEELQRLADERGITLTELFKRAVAQDKFVWDIVRQDQGGAR